MSNQLLEKACGCVPWRRNKNGNFEVLMIHRVEGFWEFPKGKQDEGESDLETAKRELKEETNLEGVLDSENAFEEHYTIERDGEIREKLVRFFLCHVTQSENIILEPSEVRECAWLNLDEIEERATFPQMKKIAHQARLLLSDYKD